MSVINFLNRHNGLTNFFCLSGPFIGKMITVRSLNLAWHNAQFYDPKGVFRHIPRQEFETDILASIGIVHTNGEPVPAGIVCRVNAELAYDRRSISNMVSDLDTGIRSPMGTWRRLSLIEQDQLFPTHVEDDLEDLRIESLPAAMLPCITNSVHS